MISLADSCKCAACGNEGGGLKMKTCTPHKLVKYCGVSCEKAHRSKFAEDVSLVCIKQQHQTDLLRLSSARSAGSRNQLRMRRKLNY
ncbi:hypothetical protein ACHAXR_001459 [Thalassiosira sp. AJA248-18]